MLEMRTQRGNMEKIAYLVVAVFAGALLGPLAFSKQSETKTVDPANLPQYKVLLNNSSLRAMDYHLKPAEKEAMHSHPCGVFVYFFTDANVRATLSDGKIGEFHSRAGDVGWRDPVTHQGENIGKSEIHALLIEPKTSRTLTREQTGRKEVAKVIWAFGRKGTEVLLAIAAEPGSRPRNNAGMNQFGPGGH